MITTYQTSTMPPKSSRISLWYFWLCDDCSRQHCSHDRSRSHKRRRIADVVMKTVIDAWSEWNVGRSVKMRVSYKGQGGISDNSAKILAHISVFAGDCKHPSEYAESPRPRHLHPSRLTGIEQDISECLAHTHCLQVFSMPLTMKQVISISP